MSNQIQHINPDMLSKNLTNNQTMRKLKLQMQISVDGYIAG